MKKGIRILFIVLLLLIGSALLIRYVFFPIVPVDYLYDQIPAGVDYVVLVDTKELVSIAISEFLRSPGSGNPFDTGEEDKDEKEKYELKDILKKGLWHGLELPEQVIHYRYEYADGPRIVLLPLSDSEAFESFLVESKEKTGLSLDENMVWSDSSYAMQVREDYLKVFLGRPELNRKLAFGGSEWHNRLMRTGEGAIARAFLNTLGKPDGAMSLQSDNGSLQLSYYPEKPLDFIPAGQSTTADAWLAVHCGPDLESLQNLLQGKNLFKKLLRKSGIEAQVLADTWDGRFELCISGLSPVEEEIVTYTYDDNFEKVEHRTTKEHIEADFNAYVGLTKPTDSLYYAQGWIKTEEGHDLFVLYPVQEVHYAEEENRVRLSSSSATKSDCIDSPKSEKFLFIDWSSLEADWNQGRPEDKQFHAGLSTVQAQLDSSRKEVKIDLKFSDTDRNGFFSVLDFFTED